MSIYEKMLLLSVQHHEINNEELKENLMDILSQGGLVKAMQKLNGL